jgi:hypothetical protein
MGNYKQGILFISFICLGVTAAVLVKSDPFVRLIPADVLRDFPGRCYSWTSGNFANPNETWSLKPFCGQSRCVALRNTETNKTFLGEEVTDCGPLVDTEKSPDCQLLQDQYDTEAEFPGCCPVYDCAEGADIVYQEKAGSNKKSPKKLGQK